MFKRLTFSAALLAATAGPGFAQTMLTANDTDAILQIARGFGKATLTQQSNGDPLITGQMHGLVYQVFFANCTTSAGCEDINFYLSFSDLSPSLEVINAWNATKRFSRAYLDSDNDPVVSMDIDLVVPVPAEYIESSFGLWSLVVEQFTAHVGY